MFLVIILLTQIGPVNSCRYSSHWESIAPVMRGFLVRFQVAALNSQILFPFKYMKPEKIKHWMELLLLESKKCGAWPDSLIYSGLLMQPLVYNGEALVWKPNPYYIGIGTIYKVKAGRFVNVLQTWPVGHSVSFASIEGEFQVIGF